MKTFEVRCLANCTDPAHESVRLANRILHVYNSDTDAPVEWQSQEFDTHGHTEVIEPEVVVAQEYREWDPFVFLNRFTVQERVTIRTRAKTDPVAEDIIHLLDIAAASGRKVTNTSSETLQSMAHLVSVGILTQERANQILYV